MFPRLPPAITHLQRGSQPRCPGRTFEGSELRTNREVRHLLLDEAGFAVVPFHAFGLQAESGWMRLSVGAVSPKQTTDGLARVRSLLEQLT